MGLVQLLVFAFAITVHESMHAATANYFGDPTAKKLGRISLNPVRHVDIFGSIIFPLVLYFSQLPIFGWAKPVPVNVANLRNPKLHHTLVAVAGPASNLLQAFVAAGMYQWYQPIASRVPAAAAEAIFWLLIMTCVVNTYLAIFNMLPIYPLDGSAVLAGLLPDNLSEKLLQLQPYGFVVLFVVMYTGGLDWFMRPMAGAVFSFFRLPVR